MTTKFYFEAVDSLKKYCRRECLDFEKIDDFYQSVIDEAEKEDKSLFCYGLVSKNYDNKLLQLYRNNIEKCKMYISEERYKYSILNNTTDEEFILTITLGFYKTLGYYIYSFHNNETFDDMNYADQLLKRLVRIFDTEKYTLFFSVFFQLYDYISFFQGNYYIE